MSAIELGEAQAIVDEYVVAQALRGGHAAHAIHMRRAMAGQAKPDPEQPARVVICSVSVEIPAGTLDVRSVLLEENATSIGIRFSEKRKRSGTMSFGGPPLSGIKVSDDKGIVTRGHFGGSGSGGVWRGRIRLDDVLEQDTSWIDIGGERIELVDAAALDARVEKLPEENPALRFLWHRLASPHHRHHHVEHLEAAIEAIVACGALPADDPGLADVRSVAEAFNQHGTARPAHGPGTPDLWQSILKRRSRRNGPRGIVRVCASTPRIDGLVAEVMSLESTEDRFALEVATSGSRGPHHPFHSQVGQSRLSWTATDDLQNHYLGAPASGGGSNESWAGTYEFEPPIDPAAKVLNLAVTGETHRCVMRIPLLWEPSPDDADGAGEDEEVFV